MQRGTGICWHLECAGNPVEARLNLFTWFLLSPTIWSEHRLSVVVGTASPALSLPVHFLEIFGTRRMSLQMVNTLSHLESQPVTYINLSPQILCKVTWSNQLPIGRTVFLNMKHFSKMLYLKQHENLLWLEKVRIFTVYSGKKNPKITVICSVDQLLG